MDATCYYAGHILRAITANNTHPIPIFDRTFAADIKLANVTDRYVTSPVLLAFQRCMTGPASVLRAPSWLGESFAQVSNCPAPRGFISQKSAVQDVVSMTDVGVGVGDFGI